METKNIIKVYRMQSSTCDDSIQWYEAAKIKLNRSHLTQVLKELGYCDNICNDVDGWLALNSWSDLVAMMDCALGIESDSYLNTIF